MLGIENADMAENMKIEENEKSELTPTPKTSWVGEEKEMKFANHYSLLANQKGVLFSNDKKRRRLFLSPSEWQAFVAFVTSIKADHVILDEDDEDFDGGEAVEIHKSAKSVLYVTRSFFLGEQYVTLSRVPRDRQPANNDDEADDNSDIRGKGKGKPIFPMFPSAASSPGMRKGCELFRFGMNIPILDLYKSAQEFHDVTVELYGDY